MQYLHNFWSYVIACSYTTTRAVIAYAFRAAFVACG